MAQVGRNGFRGPGDSWVGPSLDVWKVQVWEQAESGVTLGERVLRRGSWPGWSPGVSLSGKLRPGVVALTARLAVLRSGRGRGLRFPDLGAGPGGKGVVWAGPLLDEGVVGSGAGQRGSLAAAAAGRNPG